MAHFVVLRTWKGALPDRAPGASGVTTISEGAILDDESYDVPRLIASGVRAVQLPSSLEAILEQGDGAVGDVLAAAVQNLYDVVVTGLRSIEGLHIANNSVTPDEIVDIDPGEAVSEDGTFAIVVPSALTVDITATGLGGLDAGAPAADTWYGVWVVGDSSRQLDSGALLSTAFLQSGLALPPGYDQARRIGAVRTDATIDIRAFTQPKTGGRGRWTYWREAIQIQTAGTATSFTPTVTSAATQVPPSAVRQQVSLASNKDGGNEPQSRSELVPDGWEEGVNGAFWTTRSGTNTAGDPYTEGTHVMPVGPSRLLRYRVQPAGSAQADVEVKGWEDGL